MCQLVINTTNKNNSMTSSSYSNNNGDSLSSEDQLKYSMSSFSYGNSLNDLAMAINSSNSKDVSSSSLVNRKLKDTNSIKNNMQKFYLNQAMHNVNADNVNYLVILIGLICLAILFLPLVNTTNKETPPESYLPAYLHVSYEMKLFCSFVLGMVTMVILKN